MMEIKYLYLIGSYLFCAVVFCIIRYIPNLAEKSSKKFIAERKIPITALTVMIISIIAGAFIGVYWNYSKLYLLDMTVLLFVLAFVLFKDNIFSYKSHQYDFSDPKAIKQFAKKYSLKWKFAIDENNKILKQYDEPITRYSPEYAQIQYELLNEHINSMNNIMEKRAYIASWKLNNCRLIDNSISQCIWLTASGIVGTIYANDILNNVTNYILNNNVNHSTLIFGLIDNIIPIVSTLILVVLIISSIIYIRNDRKLIKQFYLGIIDDIKNDIEKE